MTKYIILILLSLYTLPLFSAEQSTGKIYSLQLGAYPTEEDAQQAKKNFESQGLSPAYILESKGQFKVRFGYFTSTVQAHWYKKELRNKGISPDCFVTTQENPEGRTDFPAPTLELTPKLNLQDLVAAENALEGDREVSEIKSLFNGTLQQTDLPISRLDQIIRSREDHDPAKGWAMMTLGRLLLTAGEREEVKRLFQTTRSGLECPDATTRSDLMFQSAKIMLGHDSAMQGMYDRIMPYWRDVVQGHVCSTAKDRKEALFLLARATHLYEKNRLKAFQIYRDMEKSLNDSLMDMGEILVWQAQINFEMVLSDIGQIKEARDFAKAAMERIPLENKRYRALIALMNLESYLWSNNPEDYPLGLQLCDQWESQYAEFPREFGTCIVVKGYFYWRLRDVEKSMQEHLRLRAFSEDIEWFPAVHAKEIGDLVYANYLNTQGKYEEAKKVLEETLQKYPKTSTTRKVFTALETPGSAKCCSMLTNKIYK